MARSLALSSRAAKLRHLEALPGSTTRYRSRGSPEKQTIFWRCGRGSGLPSTLEAVRKWRFAPRGDAN